MKILCQDQNCIKSLHMKKTIISIVVWGKINDKWKREINHSRLLISKPIQLSLFSMAQNRKTGLHEDLTRRFRGNLIRAHPGHVASLSQNDRKSHTLNSTPMVSLQSPTNLTYPHFRTCVGM